MKIKKLIIFALLSLAVTIPPASAADFTDIRGHWAENIINNLAEKGVVNGVSDTEFNPDGTVTIAEFYKMALGAKKIAEKQFRRGECLDVVATDWYANCIQSALDRGLIPENMIDDFSVEVVADGDGTKALYKGRLRAGIPITREQMAYITQAVYQYSLDKDGVDALAEPVDLTFDDVNKISLWALDGVTHAYVNGLIVGMDDGTFRPDNTATRAQAASIINNLLEK